MTPPIDAVARIPVPIEAPSGISESLWYSTASPGPRADAGTVKPGNESEAEILRLQGSREKTAVERLARLLRLEPGWDSYDAPAVTPTAAGCALGFLSALRGAKPTIVPTSKGGVQLEWHAQGIDIELECFPSGYARLFAEDSKLRAVEERWVSPGHPAIDTWIRRLPSERASNRPA